MEMSGQLHAPTALTSAKNPRPPLNRRLGEPQSRRESLGGEKLIIIIY
jgi:hypothetical protein